MVRWLSKGPERETMPRIMKCKTLNFKVFSESVRFTRQKTQSNLPFFLEVQSIGLVGNGRTWEANEKNQVSDCFSSKKSHGTVADGKPKKKVKKLQLNHKDGSTDTPDRQLHVWRLRSTCLHRFRSLLSHHLPITFIYFFLFYFLHSFRFAQIKPFVIDWFRSIERAFNSLLETNRTEFFFSHLIATNPAEISISYDRWNSIPVRENDWVSQAGPPTRCLDPSAPTPRQDLR